MIGNTLQEAERISFSLAYNPAIIPNIMDSNYYGSLECIYTIRSHLSKNSVFYDIMVFFPTVLRDLIYTSNGTRQLEVLREYLPLDDNLREQIYLINAPNLISAENNSMGLVTRNLVYCYPLYRSADNLYMTVFFILDSSYIREFTRPGFGHFGEILHIYNKNGDNIYTIQTDENGIKKIPEALKPEVIRYEFSNDLIFETEIPVKAIEQFIIIKQRNIRIIIFGVGIVGIILVIYFALKTYMPIYHLNRIFQSELNQKEDNSVDNELVHIGSLLGNILQENQRISSLMQDNIKYMQEQFLLILLNGDVSGRINENLGNILSVLQLNLPGPRYTVFCLYLTYGIPLHIKNEIVKYIRQSFVWHPGAVYPVNITSLDSIPIIVSLAPQISNEDNIQNEFAVSLHKLLFSLGYEGTVSGGGIYDDLIDIDNAYMEALGLLDQYGSVPEKTLIYSQFTAKEIQHDQSAIVQPKSNSENHSPGIKFEALKEYLDTNFSDLNLSLDQVAGLFNISPFQLSRDFKKNYNINFVDYISFLRIGKAKHLLAETDTKIKEIVEKVGYHDVANFIRKFRIIEGITPGQYRAKTNNK